MPANRPALPLSYPDIHPTEIQGAQSDLTIESGPVYVSRVRVTEAATTSGNIKLYNGSIATKCIATINGLADSDGNLPNEPIDAWFPDGLHVVSTDGGSTLRAVITGDFRA